MKIKLLKPDSIALQKGFRRGQVCEVVAIEERAAPNSARVANAARGRLVVALGKHGRTEGFFPDQYRIKVRPLPGEFDPPDDQEPLDPFIHSQRLRRLQEKKARR